MKYPLFPAFTEPLGCLDSEKPEVVSLSFSSISLEISLYLSGPTAPHILYFPGEQQDRMECHHVAQGFLRHGIGFIVLSYLVDDRNDKLRPAAIQALAADNQELWAVVKAKLVSRGLQGPVALMGHSLGSAVALDLMAESQEDFTALIVQSGFLSAEPIFSELGLDTNDLPDNGPEIFANVANIRRIKKPTLILHGQRDELVPAVVAEKLQAESGARNKQFQVIPGVGREGIASTVGELYFQVVSQFIDKIVNSGRRRRR